MIRIELTEREKKELERYRGQASSSKSEKGLMVLQSSEGKSPIEIGENLKRHPHTVRTWLKGYLEKGNDGLERKYSPGRPKTLREDVKKMLEVVLTEAPFEVGYQAGMWTVPLIRHHLEHQKGIKASLDTVERALKDLGYSYKRLRKGVSERAPGKEEKIAAIEKMVQEISELARQKDCEIFVLDEAHFSNEPYLIKGWQKKRWPPEDTLSGQAGKTHAVWLFESKSQKILLEKIQTS